MNKVEERKVIFIEGFKDVKVIEREKDTCYSYRTNILYSDYKMIPIAVLCST